MIIIVNYGMGNLGSILNMFKRLGVPATLAQSPEELVTATKIILPGVGSFDKAMERINESGFKEILEKKVLINKIPILGICLGMQLLTRGSEEGILPGLGWIAANTVRFSNQSGLKVPHMGWNVVHTSSQSALVQDLPEDSRFYFVHSYRVRVDHEADSILKCHYGVDFDAAIQHDNIFGVQFHPEKSHKYGMKLLENFAKL